MDWRTWVFDRLRAHQPLAAHVPLTNVHGGGSLTGRPEVPFIVINFGSKLDEPSVPVDNDEMQIHIHDDPGSYLRIDRALQEVRAALDTVVTDDGAVAIEWTSDGPDLPDDGFGTIYRTGTYRALSRRSNS